MDRIKNKTNYLEFRARVSEESESSDDVTNYFASQGVEIADEDTKNGVISKMAAMFLSED